MVLADIAGTLTGWVPTTLSVSGLVAFIVIGLATSRLYTKSQVDQLKTDHTTAMKAKDDAHALAITTLNEAWRANRDDAVRREGEWRGVADRWEGIAATLADGLDPLHEQGQTLLTVLTEMQRQQSRTSGRPR